MNEFGSELARAAAMGMCRPGWQETKPFFNTASSSQKAKWKAYTCQTYCMAQRVVSELSHGNYCPVEKRIAHISLGRKTLADEMWGNLQSENCRGMLLGRGILYDCLGKADPKETVSKTWFLIQRKHHGNLKAAERGPESKTHPPRKSLVQFKLFCCMVSVTSIVLSDKTIKFSARSLSEKPASTQTG